MTYLKCPKKSILPKAQQSLWPLLCQVPENFVLCEGTAIALIYGSSFNPQISLKALSYFEEGNLRRLTQMHKTELLHAVKSVDLRYLPTLTQLEQIWFQSKGLFV